MDSGGCLEERPHSQSAGIPYRLAVAHGLYGSDRWVCPWAGVGGKLGANDTTLDLRQTSVHIPLFESDVPVT